MKHFCIESCTVIHQAGQTDLVLLHTDLPSPIVSAREKLTLTFRATVGTGVQYLKEHFGIEQYPGTPCPIEVIDSKT